LVTFDPDFLGLLSETEKPKFLNSQIVLLKPMITKVNS